MPFATGAQQEGGNGAFLGEHHAVETLIRFGELGKASGRVEVEGPAVDQYTADGSAVTAEELGRRVVDEIRAMLEGLEQVRRRKGRIDQQRYAVLMRDPGDRGNIQHVEPRIAERFAEQQAGVRAQRGAPAVQIAGFDESRFDAEAAQRVVQQIVRAAIQGARRDDVCAGAH
jgi:hypothetical protein